MSILFSEWHYSTCIEGEQRRDLEEELHVDPRPLSPLHLHALMCECFTGPQIKYSFCKTLGYVTIDVQLQKDNKIKLK